MSDTARQQLLATRAIVVILLIAAVVVIVVFVVAPKVRSRNAAHELRDRCAIELAHADLPGETMSAECARHYGF